jgi:hypothetical protein
VPRAAGVAHATRTECFHLRRSAQSAPQRRSDLDGIGDADERGFPDACAPWFSDSDSETAEAAAQLQNAKLFVETGSDELAVPTTVLSRRNRVRWNLPCSNRRNRTSLQLLAGNRDRK